MLDFNDSIAAIATPPGRGGIAIVRISGPDARKVATLITKPHDPKLNALKELPAELPPELSAAPLKPRYVYLRKFYDGLDEVDEGVIVYYAAPHSQAKTWLSCKATAATWYHSACSQPCSRSQACAKRNPASLPGAPS